MAREKPAATRKNRSFYISDNHDSSHDPGVNLYSDGDSDGELNNRKFSPGSSPSAKDVESAFVYNDLRKGGPQGNGGSKDSTNAGKAPEQHEAVATTTQPVTQAAAQTTTTQAQTTTTQATATAAAPATPTTPPNWKCSGCKNPYNTQRYSGSRFHCDGKPTLDHVLCLTCASDNEACPSCGEPVYLHKKNQPPELWSQ